jgi:hypothetical protein
MTAKLTLRKEHRLRVFENRVLRKTFGLKGDEVTWESVEVHNVELYNLCSWPYMTILIIYCKEHKLYN